MPPLEALDPSALDGCPPLLRLVLLSCSTTTSFFFPFLFVFCFPFFFLDSIHFYLEILTCLIVVSRD